MKEFNTNLIVYHSNQFNFKRHCYSAINSSEHSIIRISGTTSSSPSLSACHISTTQQTDSMEKTYSEPE